jgi:hypothetical protein
MNSWLLRMFSQLFAKLRRPTPSVVKIDAAVLMRQFGDEAERLARKQASDAGPQQHARHWRLVANEIARQRDTGQPI